MFSLNPYLAKSSFQDPEFPVVSWDLANIHDKNIALITELSPDQSGFFHTINHLNEQPENFIFLTAKTYISPNQDEHINYISIEDKLGVIPPFMPLKSFCFLQLLKELDVDLVVVEGSPGLAFYALQYRRFDLGFCDVEFALHQPSACFYELENKLKFPAGRTEIELNCLEKAAFSRFDAVFDVEGSPFLSWAKAAGWFNYFKDKSLTKQNIDENETGRGKPFITVCLITYNRPDMLKEALDSLERQTYDYFEVVVVDDGSALEFSDLIKAVVKAYRGSHLSFYMKENEGPAKARNYAVDKAKGEYILFMDDDNIALSYELEKFATAVTANNTDILTCIPGWHPESVAAAGIPILLHSKDPVYPAISPDWLPIGGFPELNILINCVGDTNALFRKEVFNKLGGFCGDKSFVMEDMELFGRSLAAGYTLEVVPEVLFLYRKHEQSRSLAQSVFTSHIRTLLPYSSYIDEKLWPLLLCLRKGFYDRHSEITSLIFNKEGLATGEWVKLSKDSAKLSLMGGRSIDNGWAPGKNSKVSFKLNNPGRRNSIILECSGCGQLAFIVGGENYEVSLDGNSAPVIVEKMLKAGVFSAYNQTEIEFVTSTDIVLSRIAIMKVEG